LATISPLSNATLDAIRIWWKILVNHKAVFLYSSASVTGVYESNQLVGQKQKSEQNVLLPLHLPVTKTQSLRLAPYEAAMSSIPAVRLPSLILSKALLVEIH
jgi:hypothetical protein